MYNILICDDEQDIINALKIYLSNPEYSFYEASNGRAAVEAVEQNEIHLILMDIMMPGMDGISAMVKIREISNVPVILLTAKTGTPVSQVITIGGLELNDTEKTVTLDGEDLALRPKEYDILKLLMGNPGKVFSTKEIYRLVWKDSPAGSSENTVAVHIRHLREKIEINPNEPRYLKVIWGQGYKIEKELR